MRKYLLLLSLVLFAFPVFALADGSTATITLASALNVTYNGNPQSVNVLSTDPSGLSYAVTYNGSSSLPTDAGTYTVVATITDPDYTGSDTETFVINKATPQFSIDSYSVPYDGQPHTASGTATGILGEDLSSELNFSQTTHTGVGSYPSDQWTFSGDTDYQTSQDIISDSITGSIPTITVTPYVVTYDGSPHTASTTAVDPLGNDVSADVNLASTTHTSAGTYIDSWLYTDPTNHYGNQSGTVTDVINQATSTITVTPYSVSFDGNPHTASLVATGVLGEDLSADVNLASTTHTTAGTYTDFWTFTDPNGNYADATGTVIDVINAPPSSGGGGGGEGGVISLPESTSGSSVSPSVSSSPQGQVLGAEVFQFTTNLHYGMITADVTQLQTLLIKDGDLHVPSPTGYFGPLTFAAVKEYQTAHSVISTGFVGPLTRAVLNQEEQ